MNYRIAKVLNSNAVLAQDEEENQVVLMSKGIGFGKRVGEKIQDNAEDRKIFYIHDDSVNSAKLKQIDSQVQQVEEVTREIVEVARERLHIDNSKLYGALLDHITFAVECLHMGLPIDNPFCGEIAILYSREYETAQIAAEIIKERIGVEIGDGETGFIALHLYSARENRHIRSAMKSTRVYSEILSMVGNAIDKKLDNTHAPAKSFLLSLHCLVTLTVNRNPIVMKLNQQVKLSMLDSYRTALQVAKMIYGEMDVQLSEDAVAFIAVDIEKLKQL
ncbi:PRD domain-containing protein [Caproiciproducens sp. CPB-2]|uniref:PRD domain-containing protein n=1 Tax=Caproiciproducens sp. CPB-2 TaxID=3030017 RepID=UPI0023DBAD09|nr:PRD domain-containing protein [Caproiciproducens sp. CPB-2]MDF1493331.1 PRD domain-containing protein [Caproiciproducens sp. CPB-2]